MRILDGYIGRILTTSTFITLAVFVSVGGIIKFVEQIKAVGRGNYDVSHAALYVLYSVPRDIEVFFPMATLIGGLIGIGMLASNSELVVMQAAGLSKLDIIKSVMKTAGVLILISMAVGEWLAPPGAASAKQIRAQAISGGSLISAKNGVWAKDGDNFLHIGEVEDQGSLKNVQIYRFNKQLKLDSWLSADVAIYIDEKWHLTNVIETFVEKDQITTKKISEKQITSSLTPEKLGVIKITPESLSIQGLLNYLDYLSANNQDESRYSLALWRKIIQPLTVGVMLLVALSFIFGPLRSVSMGARIMMGVFTGILFYISNQVLGSLSLVYQFPPLLGALMPSVIFVSISLLLMKKA